MADTQTYPPREEGGDSANELADLYRSWGILDLLDESIEHLPSVWLQILNIARNLLDGKPISGVTIPAEISALLSREDGPTWERRMVKRKPKSRPREESDEIDVRPIESFSEFPRIVVGQRMWQFIEPDLFIYKIYAHDVLVREQEEKPPPAEDEEALIEELVAVPKSRRKPRQRVLVLRDTSSSMRDSSKGIFAKAVALAYLVKAQEEGAEVGDRSFANTVHPRLRADAPAGFAAIARRILKEGFYGTTNLAAAFEVTMSEIRREELGINPLAIAKTEILLISDCENPEPLPPLPPGVTVNTLHLEGGKEGLMVRDYQERLREIQEISALFVRVDTSALQLPDASREAWTLLEETRAIQQELESLGEGRTPADADLSERLTRVQRLITVYERMAQGARAYKGLKAEMGRLHLGRRAGLRELLDALIAKLRALLDHRVPSPPLESTAPAPAHHHMTTPHGVVFRPKGR